MSNEHVSLTAAECASQTGLTVKALRVYERYGLITPRRTAKGWRYYGAEDLMRLNTITVLKAAGLTLVQIRETINQQNPSLEQVLRVQIEAWKSRRADAERGQALAELSLERLQTHQSISVDDLCNLVRSLEMSSTNRAIKDAFERHMTPEEQQVWTSGEAARNHEAYIEAQRTQIFPELEKLMTAGYEATSPEVQALVDRNSQLMTQYRIRELGLQQSTSEIVLKAMRARTELALQAAASRVFPRVALARISHRLAGGSLSQASA